MSVAPLSCPKCAGAWQTKHRNGVTVDRCTGCQGVFLDRGELKLLIDAESEYLASLPGADPDATYQGRHRGGVVAELFGTE